MKYHAKLIKIFQIIPLFAKKLTISKQRRILFACSPLVIDKIHWCGSY